MHKDFGKMNQEHQPYLSIIKFCSEFIDSLKNAKPQEFKCEIEMKLMPVLDEVLNG